MTQNSQYAKRRQALMKMIGAKDIVIIPSAPEYLRNNDAVFPFRQNSDFYYLTGFNEPESILVLAPNREQGEYILFSRKRDPDREIWDGPRAGQAGARETYLADEAFAIEDFYQVLPDLLAGRETVHYPLGLQSDFDKSLIHTISTLRAKIRSGVQAPKALEDISPSIHELRLFKDKFEIAKMQQAVDITVAAHLKAMQVCQPGLYEYELEAELTSTFQRQGARFTAYGSIVGAGENTCVLHYVANNKKIADGDLVLIDAGAELDNYAADVTRTFPANGKFSSEQKAVYEIVLAAQLAGIQKVKPGSSWTAAQDAIVKVITEGLVELGLLKGKVEALIEKEAYVPFYMHRSGHWLGLDVHDVGSYKLDNKWRKLQAGMVLTVEPGIYISKNIPGVDKRWHNIGIRIEDDVLVTEKDCTVLSAKLPKTVAAIEKVMSK